jgi:hypothetical protein
MDKSFLLVTVVLMALSVVPLMNSKERGPASVKGILKVGPSTENVGREFVNGLIK